MHPQLIAAIGAEIVVGPPRVAERQRRVRACRPRQGPWLKPSCAHEKETGA